MSFSKNPPRIIPWANISNALLLILPLLLAARWPLLRIPPFTPRQLIYSKDILSFFLAPWSWPASLGAFSSRLIQAALLFKLPANPTSVPSCYGLWILVALARTLTGFLLTRSVGWAYPRLFNHYALYETIGGLGPPLIIYFGVTGFRTWTESITLLRSSGRWTLDDRGILRIVLLCGLMSCLDAAPWTYAVASLSMLGLVLIQAILCRLFRTRHHPLTLESSSHSEKSPPQASRLSNAVQIALLSLIIIPQPSLLGYILFPEPKHLSMPPSPRAPSPLLEILILSHPRPTDIDFFNSTYMSAVAAATPTKATFTSRTKPKPYAPMPSSILYSTISSYLPFLPSERDSKARLSVFTHTLPHPAFTHARSYLSLDASLQHTNVPLEFYFDGDEHPDARSNQYLHLAEALRWADGGGGGGNRDQQGHEGHIHDAAEWILVVEDDFALCGLWGWNGIVRVMMELEAGRSVVDGKETLERWGGFVGTGGSGLIIHRSLLSLLSFILRAHAAVDSPLPQHIRRRPADLIIQDCLLGIDPLCPQPSSKFKSASPASTDEEIIDESGGGSLVITSRLVMDHIGGSASTAKGRVYDEGKWRCGWRHPFHGREEVDVIVV